MFICEGNGLKLQGGSNLEIVDDGSLNTAEASPYLGNMLSEDFFLIRDIKSTSGVKKIYYRLRVWSARQALPVDFS